MNDDLQICDNHRQLLVSFTKYLIMTMGCFEWRPFLLDVLEYFFQAHFPMQNLHNFETK